MPAGVRAPTACPVALPDLAERASAAAPACELLRLRGCAGVLRFDRAPPVCTGRCQLRIRLSHPHYALLRASSSSGARCSPVGFSGTLPPPGLALLPDPNASSLSEASDTKPSDSDGPSSYSDSSALDISGADVQASSWEAQSFVTARYPLMCSEAFTHGSQAATLCQVARQRSRARWHACLRGASSLQSTQREFFGQSSDTSLQSRSANARL